MGIFRTSSLGGSISSNPKRNAPRRQREKPGYIEALHQRAGNLNIKRLLLVKENQISQVMEFSTFLSMERCKSLGLWKLLFHVHIPIWGQHPMLLTSWAPLGLTIGSGCRLVAIRAQVFFSFLCALRVHWLILEGYNCCWLWHPYLLIRQAIFHFSNPTPWPSKKEKGLEIGSVSNGHWFNQSWLCMETSVKTQRPGFWELPGW